MSWLGVLIERWSIIKVIKPVEVKFTSFRYKKNSHWNMRLTSNCKLTCSEYHTILQAIKCHVMILKLRTTPAVFLQIAVMRYWWYCLQYNAIIGTRACYDLSLCSFASRSSWLYMSSTVPEPQQTQQTPKYICIITGLYFMFEFRRWWVCI